MDSVCCGHDWTKVKEMPDQNVMERLSSGDVLLMDGGTGSEVQRRGVEVLHGASSKDGLGAWSATANLEAPDVVQQVHQDYLRVGADILITNNFWTTPSRLETINQRNRWKEYAQAAVECGLRAREALNPDAYLAGGFAPPSNFRRPGTSGSDTYRSDEIRPDVEAMGEKAFRQEMADHARLLAETGVDVILPEYVCRIADGVASVDACAEFGLPVWLGVRLVTQDGLMENGETVDDLISALKGHPVDALLLMCCMPEAISAVLPRIRDRFEGPVGGYPNVGYAPIAPLGPIGMHVFPDKPRTTDFMQGWYPPSQMADFAGQWVEMGAQIVGGCCATGPEHIMAMRSVVKNR